MPVDLAHLEEVSRRDRLIEDQRGAGDHVLEGLLGRQRHGDTANAETGKRGRRIDAEMPERRQHADEDDEHVHDPARDTHERLRRGSASNREPPYDIGFELTIEENHQPDERRDGEERRSVGPDLAEHQRQRQGAQQPPRGNRHEQQPGRHRQQVLFEQRRVLEEPSPQSRNQRPQEPVEEHSDEVEQRNPEQHDKPFDDAYAADFPAGEDARQRSLVETKRHFAVQRWDGVERRGGKQPDRLLVRSGDPLDNDVDRAVACWNSARRLPRSA